MDVVVKKNATLVICMCSLCIMLFLLVIDSFNMKIQSNSHMLTISQHLNIPNDHNNQTSSSTDIADQNTLKKQQNDTQPSTSSISPPTRQPSYHVSLHGDKIFTSNISNHSQYDIHTLSSNSLLHVKMELLQDVIIPQLMIVPSDLNMSINDDDGGDHDYFTTSHTQSYFTHKCALIRPRYLCYPFNDDMGLKYAISFQNLSLIKHIMQQFGNQHLYFQSNVVEKFMNRLKINGTLFATPNSKIVVWGNSHLRQLNTALSCIMVENKFTDLLGFGKAIAHLYNTRDETDTHFRLQSNIPCFGASNDNAQHFFDLLSQKQLSFRDFVFNFTTITQDWINYQKYNIYKQKNSNKSVNMLDIEKVQDYLWKQLDGNGTTPLCGDWTKIEFINDESSIYFHFSDIGFDRLLNVDGTLFEQQLLVMAAKDLNISKFDLNSPIAEMIDNQLMREWIKDIDLLIVNHGNLNYDTSLTLENEIKIIEKKYRSGKTLPVIITGAWNFDKSKIVSFYTNHNNSIAGAYWRLNQIWSQHVLSIKAAQNLYSPIWEKRGAAKHFCLPGIPSHYLFTLLEMIDFVLDPMSFPIATPHNHSTFTTVKRYNKHKENMNIIDLKQDIEDQCNKLNIKEISKSKINFITPNISQYLLNRRKCLNCTRSNSTMDHAPYLISYPGSGNTLTRIGIEYITQYYTSSIYNDKTLHDQSGFKGEYVKSVDHWNNVICVKLHPGYSSNKKTYDLSPYDLAIKENIASIFIQRDPIDAIFAFFQWKYANLYPQLNMTSKHTSKISVNKFEKQLKPYKNFAFLNSFASEQFSMWNKDFENIQSNLIKAGKEYLYLDILFENLVDSNVTIMTNEWIKLVNFLFDSEFLKTTIGDIVKNRQKSVKYQTFYQHVQNMINITNMNTDYTILDIFKARIHCFFPMNKVDKRMSSIHRRKGNLFYHITQLANGTNVNQTYQFITKQIYWNAVKNQTKCNLLKKYKTKMNFFGYSAPQQWSCN